MKIFIKIIALGALVSVLLVGMLVADGLIDNVGTSDVIVVLGNKVELDGTPSARLKSRLDKAVELYDQGRSSRIFVSGGIDQEGTDEAYGMKAYLIKVGVPSEAVFEDNQGIDSYETAHNTAAFLNEKDLKSALVVTNYYHISRTRLAFHKAGVSEVYSAHANHFELRDLYSIPREIIGYAYYLVRD